MSFWEKISLGPARTLKCNSCRRPVGVIWLHSLIHILALGLTPLLLVLTVLVILDSSEAGWFGIVIPAAAVALGVAFELWLYYRFVPLVARAA